MEKIFENFTVNILKLNKLVHKIKTLEMREFDLKTIHVMCVYYLNVNPDGLTSGELVKLTLEDKAAISRAVKCLLDKGYISYDNRKYNSLITLTDSGKKLAELIDEKSLKAVEAASAPFTEEERLFFYNSLKSISDRLEAYADNLDAQQK